MTRNGSMHRKTNELTNKPTNYNKYPGYDIKQSDEEVPVMKELWSPRPRVVSHDSVLSMGHIELFEI